jgi:hypothetical protein
MQICFPSGPMISLKRWFFYVTLHLGTRRGLGRRQRKHQNCQWKTIDNCPSFSLEAATTTGGAAAAAAVAIATAAAAASITVLPLLLMAEAEAVAIAIATAAVASITVRPLLPKTIEATLLCISSTITAAARVASKIEVEARDRGCGRMTAVWPRLRPCSSRQR